MANAQLPRSAAGANAAAIQATVDQFRADLGGPDNGSGGTFTTGRREINWDGVPDGFAAPGAIPGDFFNTTSPRGLLATTPGAGFQVSNDNVVPQFRFGHIVPAYADQFQTFSAARLFTATGSNITDVTFTVPGTAIPATVKGFGVIFTDVDTFGSTTVEFFDVDGASFGVYPAPQGSLSFVGVSWPTQFTIARVRITSGDTPLGAAEGLNDLVVMDDFIYGEPQPPSFEFFLSTSTLPENPGPAFFLQINRRGSTALPASADIAVTGSAAQFSDYTLSATTVDFAAAEASDTVFFDILNDGAREGLEVVRLTLHNASPQHGIGPLNTFTLLLVDDELGPPTAYATTADNEFVSFDATEAGALSTVVPIVGLQPAETIVGLDHRPADGLLYGLGSTGRFYRITPDVGSAAAAAIGGPFAPALTGTTFGSDFDPVTDRLRLVSEAGENVRVHPETGELLAPPDGALAYAPGDPNVGQVPDVTGIAFTSNFPGALDTTLVGLDAQTDSLVLIDPATGQLTTVGPVGVDIREASLDIQQGTNLAFAIITTTIDPVTTYLYLIELATGRGSLIDIVALLTPKTYTGFTLVPNGVLRLTTPPASTTEGGAAQVFVERVGGSAGTIEGTLTATGGTATAGLDFVNAFGVVTFNDGEVGPIPIPVDTIDDALGEGPETVDVALAAAPAGANAPPTAAIVTILDNELPSISITDVIVPEGNAGTSMAAFTLNLSFASGAPVTVQFATADGTAIANADYTPVSGMATFDAGETVQIVEVPVIAEVFPEGPSETFFVNLSDPVGATIADAQATGTITDADMTPTYYFAEGATGTFFDLDIALANPHAVAANVDLTFFTSNGAPPVTISRLLPASSRTTIRVDEVPGLEEQVGVSTKVESVDGLPLVVDRLMSWDASGYGGHMARATNEPSTTWLFAEGVQNGSAPQSGALPYFDTFLLLANPQAVETTATVRFLLEPSGTVTKEYALPAGSRQTVYVGAIPEVVGHAFALEVTAPAPILAERSTYFGGARFWDGGQSSTGVPAAATSWFLAEGATGTFFETYLALANPNASEAQVALRYLLPGGTAVVKDKTIPAGARLTINVEIEDPQLANAAVSTVVESDVPIVAERMMYWPDPVTSWSEAHATFGVTEPGLKWALAEGRAGLEPNYQTYVLIANPGTADAEVTVTFFRNAGAPIVKQYTVLAGSRFNVDVATMVPELANEAFSSQVAVTNAQPVVVEGSVYWNALGVQWAGGSAIVATRLP